MADDYAKVKSQLDGTDEQEEQAIEQAVTESQGSWASRMLNKGVSAGSNLVKNAADVGTKALAGGLAAVQSVSVTSVAVVLSMAIGVGGVFTSGEDYPIEYRDDYIATNQYACLDEYSEAYAGVFGSLNEQPLPEQDNNVLVRLKEINEWSKEYVNQSIPDKLVCDEPDCVYYGHEGCTDPDHAVRQVSNGTDTYSVSGAKIDLANVKRIHSFFSAYGLTDVQIAAICGVMTVESHVDFTSVENYNIQGERYNLDPSVATSRFGFKPWAEGLGGSPITTATCIHQIINNTQPGPEDSIDYSSYSSDHSKIWKLGIGIVGFTDGPGFQLNTYLRNYADYINDRVTLIQRLIEGTKGWQEDLRKRAADLYHIAYGAKDVTKRGNATCYIKEVESLLILGGPEKSTGWEWKTAYNDYIEADKAFKKIVDEYNSMMLPYIEAADELRSQSWKYHTFSEISDGTAYSIVFEKHDAKKEHVKYTTDYGSGEFVTTCVPEELKECDQGEKTIDYVEYNVRNNIDVVFAQMEPVYEEEDKGALSKFIMVCHCLPDPGTKPVFDTDAVSAAASAAATEAANAAIESGGSPMEAAALAAQEVWEKARSDFEKALSDWEKANADYVEAQMEHEQVQALIDTVNSFSGDFQSKYEAVQAEKENYDEKLKKFNQKSQAHAVSVVKFYNALHDYYTAAEFDMEAMIRDAAFRDTSVYNDVMLFTFAANNYQFNASLDGERLSFREVFRCLNDGTEVDDPDSDKEPDPTVSELRLYYELWQNYAKYATNLPHSGKYINWWTPEVQLLYLVGGSYRSELGRGIKISDEYRLETNPTGCPICSANVGKYDTAGQYYYEWMSTWKGDDYTGRDITTATKNFFYDMISGGFDDGSLQLRTEYAYAYYYMFQYGTPYQKAIAYTSVGGEAADIMDEMIAEGRWQTNTSNTLSDTAMPHNDKWKEYQTAEITRQWEIDTSTSMSSSLLSILGEKQSRSKVNLLENIWNGCRYINVIDNSTLGNAAIYLADNPLIYESKDNKYYIMKYGDGESSAAEPVSALYKVVYNIINRRLADNGKPTMGGDEMMTDGFTFVKTAVLWSGLDKEFENITNIDELSVYLEEASSSIWQNSEDYQSSMLIGKGNTRIWEQRKLGPYYDDSGEPYYKYKWYLVPRVLAYDISSNTNLKWYDGIREDSFANSPNGDAYEDFDYWNIHYVDEHDTNNMPLTIKGHPTDGYGRPLNENGRTADWVRVDWECWDEDCPICRGRGGHGDTSVLLPGDIIIGPDCVGMWLGEDTVQAMYPLEEERRDKLVYVGGTDAQKMKSMNNGMGFTWSQPCSSYINHDVDCPTHVAEDALPTAPMPSDPDSCVPYNPYGKWTVYRLSVSNYTDSYRSAGVTYSHSGDDDWEIWYKYRYKGMEPAADTKRYLQEVRKDLNKEIYTNYGRDTRG